MTLVNTETGELLDTAAADRRAMKISLRLDTIAENYQAVMPMIRQSIELRDDMALGYRSPGDYIADRFGQALSALGVELRREVVKELTEAGLSTRAIAPVVGVSNFTVHADQKSGVSDLTPDPKPVTEAEDQDSTSEPESTDAPAAVQAEDEGAEVSDLTAVSEQDAAPPRPPVTGIDGKTYTPPPPKAPAPRVTPEQRDAEENSQTLASSLLFLLAFQNPNMRDHARSAWEAGREAVTPSNRGFVTSNHMREAAQGLTRLADEWENR